MWLCQRCLQNTKATVNPITVELRTQSNVRGIDENGRTGFSISASRPAAIQSLAEENSPNDSKTLPKLYLKWKAM